MRAKASGAEIGSGNSCSGNTMKDKEVVLVTQYDIRNFSYENKIHMESQIVLLFSNRIGFSLKLTGHYIWNFWFAIMLN